MDVNNNISISLLCYLLNIFTNNTESDNSTRDMLINHCGVQWQAGRR